MTEPRDTTGSVAHAAGGDRDAVDRLVPLVYDELRRIAHRRLRGERADHTLDTTALVHEAYLELAGARDMPWRSREHFLAVAARAMRRVLIDYAVQRGAQKRNAGRPTVPLDEVEGLLRASGQRLEELLALDEALERLAAVSERQCQVVECRFFAGMSVEDTAAALGTSPATVKRDWTVARAWLHRELES